MNSFRSSTTTADNIIVITIIKSSYFSDCLYYYNLYKLNSNRIFFVFLNFNKYLYDDNIYKYIDGSFIPTSYYENLSFTSNHAFVNSAKEQFVDNFYVSYIYTNSYCSLLVFKDAVLKALEESNEEWPNTDYIRLSLLDLKIQTPSGFITVDDTNYVEKPAYLLEILEDGKMNQVYPSNTLSIIYESKAFYNGTPEEYHNKKCFNIKNRSEIIKWICISYAILNIILELLGIIFTIYFRYNKIIKSSSIHYYIFLIIGLFIGSISIILLSLTPDKNSYICNFRVISCGLSVILVISVLMSKALKLRKFKHKRNIIMSTSLLYILKNFILSYIPIIIITLIYLTTSKSEYFYFI